MIPASLRVKRVVVMEDRAQVERSGSVRVPPGAVQLEIAGLSLVAVDRSLKVELAGARFVDARIERRWKEVPRGGLPADATVLRRRVDDLEDELRAREDVEARAVARQEHLVAIRADLLRSFAELAGAGTADPSSWESRLERISTRQAETDEALRVARADLERTRGLLQEAQQALATAEQAEEQLECRLILSIDGPGGEVGVRATYLVPCAVWRPTYRATLSATGEVLVEAEGLVWQQTGEPWSEVELRLSTARPTLGTAPPRLSEDRLATRPKLAEEKRVVDVAVREEVTQSAGEGGGASELPGLDDGGEARLVTVPGTPTVPSDGQPHRVPLFSFTAPAQVELVCPAELSTSVFTVARFPNASGQLIMAGPVDLVRSSGFVGRSLMPFAAPGETVKLSFGSEDGLLVTRTTEQKIDESRLTGRRTTVRKVALHVSNARPQPAGIVIEERVPVSEVKEVEVQVLTKECAPPPASVSKEGVARIELSLPASGTKTVRFTWELVAAGKVAGV